MDIRYKIIFGIIISILLIIFVRLYYIAIVAHSEFENAAMQNIMRTETLIPARGQILDRNKKPLAVNDLGFSISLNPYLGRKKSQKILDKELESIVALIPELDFDELKEEYQRQYSSYNHDYIVVAKFVPYEQIHKAYTPLMQSENIRISNTTRRLYPNDALASHIVGYIGAANDRDIEDNITAKYTGLVGRTGLEYYYNDFLQGNLGYIKTKVNVLNRPIEEVGRLEANKRQDMILSIDIDLQKEMDLAYEDKAGAAIIMDAHNGEILAAGSYPEYNLNDFVGGISHDKWNALRDNPNKPLINKMINGTYPPGSVIKMGVAMSFLEYAEINEKSVIETPPFVEIGGRKFRDWTAAGHGSADLVKAIRRSVDVYFYRLSYKIGIERMASTLRAMGLGSKTGIDLANEYKGILPTPSWKLSERGEPWSIGDTINASIGQGLFLTTPMQITRYTALLATGKLPTPHFAKQLGDDELEFPVKETLSNFQKSKLPAIGLGMYQVCNSADGTAYYATIASPVQLACKTGTAQVVGIPQDIKVRIAEKDMEYFHRSHAWITAYLPYKNPKYVITILVEHGGGAGRATGPILTALSKKMTELGYVKKDR